MFVVVDLVACLWVWLAVSGFRFNLDFGDCMGFLGLSMVFDCMLLLRGGLMPDVFS